MFWNCVVRLSGNVGLLMEVEVEVLVCIGAELIGGILQQDCLSV